MNEISVSVLIPAYNHEKYIQETIQSIINQTYKNIELIIIDDGSKDMTWQKIQEMRDVCENRFTNVIFKTKSNEGTCETLNKLKNLAQGEYIFITASDDILKSDCIEKELKFLSKNPEYVLCVGDNEFIDSHSNICYWGRGRKLIYNPQKAIYKTFSQYFIKHDWRFKNFGKYDTLYIGNYIPNGYLIKNEILKKINFTPDAPLEDWYLMLQLSKYGKFKYIPEVLFSYRWHDTNTAKNTKKMNDYCKKTRIYENKLLSTINLQGLQPEVEKVLNDGATYLNFKIIDSVLEISLVLKPKTHPYRIIVNVFNKIQITVFKL